MRAKVVKVVKVSAIILGKKLQILELPLLLTTHRSI